MLKGRHLRTTSGCVSDTHPEGLTYSIYYYTSIPTAPEMVEISLEDLWEFLDKHFPNYGIESFGLLFDTSEPTFYIHTDEATMMDSWNTTNVYSRIGQIICEDGVPAYARIIKGVLE